MAGQDTWRGVVVTAGLELGAAGLARIASDAVERELPAIAADPDLMEAGRRSAIANIDLLVQIVAGGGSLDEIEPPPASIAFARELARRRMPVADLGRAYRVAQHALWRWAVAEIHRRVPGPQAASVAIEGVSDAVFATGDVLSTLVMDRYALERERWARSAEAVRSATVTGLLAGGLADATAAGRRLGYELRRRHRAFVVWGEAEEAAPETVAEALAGPRGLVVGLAAGVIAGWAPAEVVERAVAAPGRPAYGARIAVGAAADGLAGFRSSHHQALEARRVARLIGTGGADGGPAGGVVVHHRDIALLALLTHDLDQARAFVTATLGPLAEDDPTARRLALTLHALLREQGSPRRAGHRLGVHENTVAKRQRAIDALLDPATRRPVVELLAALELLVALRQDGEAA